MLKILENGLTVSIIKDELAPLVSVRTFVKAGSVFESGYFGSGISHYVEHLVAGGTTSKRSEQEYRDALVRMGGAYNAYTTYDHTSYYINALNDQLPQAISIMNEWMNHSAFKLSEVKRERAVIQREIEKNNADIPRQFYRLCQENTYKHHPIHYPVIGELSAFNQLKRSDLVRYYTTYYTPRNMVLVIGGNIDEAETLALVEATFGTCDSRPLPLITYHDEPHPFTARTVKQSFVCNTTYLSLRYRTVDLVSDDIYALDLLEYALASGEKALLYKRLVDETQLAYSISASSYTPSFTSGYLEITAEIDEANIQAVIDEIHTILTTLKNTPLTDHDIKRLKQQKKSGDILSLSTLEDRMSKIGNGLFYGQSDTFFDDYLTRLEAVTPDDVQRCVNTYLKLNTQITTIITPPTNVDTPKSKSIKKSGATAIKHTLKNGLRIILQPDDSLPKCHVRVFMLGGLRAETTETNGIGYCMMDMICRRSKRYSKEDLQTLIEDNGASLSGSMGNNTVFISLDCLSENIPELLPVMTESMLNPIFHPDDLHDVRRRTLQTIAQRQDDWYRNGMYQFKQAFYQSHPYHFSMLGEPDSLNALTPDKIQAAYNAHLNPDGMVVTVIGQFNEQDVLTELTHSLGNLPKKKENRFSTLTRPLHQKPTESHLSITQDDVAALFIGYDGLSHTDEHDTVILDVFNAVLSGIGYPGGRLHHDLREHGYVYLVHGVQTVGIDPGCFLIYALTTPAQSQDALNLIQRHMTDLSQTPISDKEFTDAIAQCRFHYQDRLDGDEAKALLYATDELYGLGFDHSTKLEKKLKSVTKKDIQSMAKRLRKAPQTFLFLKK